MGTGVQSIQDIAVLLWRYNVLISSWCCGYRTISDPVQLDYIGRVSLGTILISVST